MLNLSTLQLSIKTRLGLGQWTGGANATFGLILTILCAARQRPAWVRHGRALHSSRLLVHFVDQFR